MPKNKKLQPAMRHKRYSNYGEGRISTWWTIENKRGGSMPLDSDNLRPAVLPVGLEVTIATMIRHLPSGPAVSRERAECEFLKLTENMS